MQKRIILVCGLSHSGTTLVDAMLGNDKNGFSCGELYSLYTKPPRQLKCSCCVSGKCSFWSKLTTVPKSSIHEYFLNYYDFIVDSSKFLPWVEHSIKSHHLHCGNLKEIKIVKLVLVQRTPEETFYSFWKRRMGRGHGNIELFVRNSKRYYSNFLKLDFPFIQVSLNSLLKDPKEKNFQKLCAEVGIPWMNGKRAFWTDHRHRLHGSGKVAAIMRNLIPSKFYSPPQLETIKNFPLERVSEECDKKLRPVLDLVDKSSEVSII